jgi:hypothetical protein
MEGLQGRLDHMQNHVVETNNNPPLLLLTLMVSLSLPLSLPLLLLQSHLYCPDDDQGNKVCSLPLQNYYASPRLIGKLDAQIGNSQLHYMNWAQKVTNCMACETTMHTEEMKLLSSWVLPPPLP